MSRDACEVIDRFDSRKTLHYIDPPYVPDARSTGGYVHELDEAGHRRLAKQLRRCKGKVVLSGYPSKLYAERHAKTGADAKRTERVWMNF